MSTAEEMEKDRLKAILQLPELAVFGGKNNDLAAYFAFETSMSVDQVRAETLAIRSALAAIDIPGMATDNKETNSND